MKSAVKENFTSMVSRSSVVFLSLLVVPIFLSGASASAQNPASCTFTMFNPPSGFSGNFFPKGINHFNTVVGGAYTTNTNSSEAGYTRFSGGGTSIFKAPNALFTQLKKRNANGVSVGQYTPKGGVESGPGTHGVILTSSSQATLDYPGADFTLLNGINKSNVIVGTADSTSGSFGFKYVNGKFTKIVFPNAVQTTATAVNDNGVIVGGYELRQL